MKCLTVTIDDRTVFSGEIAEYQYSEGVESVSLTARFTPSPNVLQSLQALAKRNAPPAGSAQSPDANASPGRPALDVVRNPEE